MLQDKNRVVIAIGSNINSYANIKLAVELLKKRFLILKQSKLVETDPIGITDQPVFVNGTVLIETVLDQKTLIDDLKQIEDFLGRDRSRPKFGPREIDLDLLVWNGDVVNNDYYERSFLQLLTKEVVDLV